MMTMMMTMMGGVSKKSGREGVGGDSREARRGPLRGPLRGAPSSGPAGPGGATGGGRSGSAPVPGPPARVSDTVRDDDDMAVGHGR